MDRSQRERRCKANQMEGRCLKFLLLFRIVIQQSNYVSASSIFKQQRGNLRVLSALVFSVLDDLNRRSQHYIVPVATNAKLSSEFGTDKEVNVLQATQVKFIYSKIAHLCVYVDTHVSRHPIQLCFPSNKRIKKNKGTGLHRCGNDVGQCTYKLKERGGLGLCQERAELQDGVSSVFMVPDSAPPVLFSSGRLYKIKMLWSKP